MGKNTLKPIIYTGLFLIPFIPFLVSSSFFFPFITTKAFAWRIIVEVVFAAWLLLALRAPEYRPKKSVIFYALALFLAVVGLSDLLGVAPVKSFWSNYERMEGFISLIHLGMFFLVISSVFKEADWKYWWNTTLTASFFMVVYSAFQLAGSIQIHQGGARVDGTLGNASYLAVYMLFHIFIALLFLWREKKNVSLRWIYGALIVLQTWVLYNTATRGAILGFIGGVLIVAFLNLRNKENKWFQRMSIAVISVTVLIVGGVYFARESAFVKDSLVLSRFASISTEELKSGGRSFVWPMAIDGFKERPLLGWGQDNFNYVFNKNYDPKMYMLEPWFDRAHNIFLDWMVASGTFGLLFYLSLYAAFLWVLWRDKAAFIYEERTILTALLAAYFFHNFFVFDQLVSYFLFASLLAYVHSRSEAPSLKPATVIKESVLNRVAVPIAIVILAASLYWVNLKPIIANNSLIDALIAVQSSPSDPTIAISEFTQAYEKSRLGRPEAVEQIVSATPGILGSSLWTAQKNDFYNFAKNAVIKQATDATPDARYYILAGMFLVQTGSLDEAITYLNRANELIPGKPQVYLEIAQAYYAKGDKNKAVETLRKVSELVPELSPQMEEYIKQIQNN
ncbi:MAG: O-antigen ligase family protein, partial [bacterium]|nr:O-antigen ligase family protein [bacterium]